MAKKSRNRRAAAVEPPPSASIKASADEARAAPKRRPLDTFSPGAIGVYLGSAFGLAFLILGVLGALREDSLPPPLVLALCVAGGLQMALGWQTLQRSRTAWSFAVALSGTVTLACLFGAPKIRDAMSVPIGIAVLPALVALVVTCLLAAAADDVSSRSPD